METEEQIVGEMKTDYERSVKGRLGLFMYKAQSPSICEGRAKYISMCDLSGTKGGIDLWIRSFLTVIIIFKLFICTIELKRLLSSMGGG